MAHEFSRKLVLIAKYGWIVDRANRHHRDGTDESAICNATSHVPKTRAIT